MRLRRRWFGRRRNRIGLQHRRGRGVVGRGFGLGIVGRRGLHHILRHNGHRHRGDQRLGLLDRVRHRHEGERDHPSVQGEGSEDGRARTAQGAQASGAVSVIRFSLVKPEALSRAMTRATA
ncbi:MAG: hypothetical protein DI624_05230 [Brevundimonas sp.]|nr:MAG: hypothetical protein DI624_05230 [Brevundimonas sp.]